MYASAAVGVVGKLNSFAIMPSNAMSMSVSSMAAQNIGAGSYERAKQSLRYGIAIALSIGAVMFIIVQLFPAAFVRLFSSEPEVVRLGVQYIRSFSLDYLAVPFAFCLGGLITGSGHTTFSLFTGTLTSIAVRMPVAWLLSRTSLGLMGVGFAAPIASVVGAGLSLWFILSGRWMKDVTGIHKAQTE